MHACKSSSVCHVVSSVNLFKRFLLDKVLSGDKWVTRRPAEKKKGAQQYEVGEKVGVRCGFTKF